MNRRQMEACLAILNAERELLLAYGYKPDLNRKAAMWLTPDGFGSMFQWSAVQELRSDIRRINDMLAYQGI